MVLAGRMLDMLSVLLATVSARCVRVKVGLGLGLEHEDPGCSRGAERDDGSITRHGAPAAAALAQRGICSARRVRFRRVTFFLWA